MEKIYVQLDPDEFDNMALMKLYNDYKLASKKICIRKSTKIANESYMNDITNDMTDICSRVFDHRFASCDFTYTKWVVREIANASRSSRAINTTIRLVIEYTITTPK